MAGLELDGPDDLSEEALTHGAGPGSGASRPVLCSMARTNEL